MGSGGREMDAASPDLQNELQEALEHVGIKDADPDTIGILDYAARLTPDDAEPPISTTRLFAGAVKIGQISPKTGSYPGALATAIAKDHKLSESYQEISKLFQAEP